MSKLVLSNIEKPTFKDGFLTIPPQILDRYAENMHTITTATRALLDLAANEKQPKIRVIDMIDRTEVEGRRLDKTMRLQLAMTPWLANEFGGNTSIDNEALLQPAPLSPENGDWRQWATVTERTESGLAVVGLYRNTIGHVTLEGQQPRAEQVQWIARREQ